MHVRAGGYRLWRSVDGVVPSVRDLARSLDEAGIRAGAGAASYQRGKTYASTGAVLRLEANGRYLDASVQGNDLDPYTVRIALDAAGVAVATCTCAFSGSGWCKHVVATLLAAQTAADAVGADEGRPVSQAGSISVDGAAVSRRVRGILRSLGALRPSEAYWSVGDVMRQVEHVLRDANRRLEAGRAQDALVILTAITVNYVRAWDYLDDSDGFVGAFGSELAPVWTEALLSAELAESERRAWTKKLTAWNEELTSIGLDNCLDACVIAAAGWDESAVLPARILDELVGARLNVLRRQGDDASFLRLATRHRRTLRYATRLVELQRVDEAVTAMRARDIAPADVLTFAVFLRERGELERAVSVATGAFERDRRGELATWLRDVADSLGRHDLARKAARIAVSVRPSKDALRRLRDMVPPNAWNAERDHILTTLRTATMPATDGTIDVFLEADAVADAIAIVDRLTWTSFATLTRVVKAAVAADPQWAIARAQREAERIVDAGQSTAYHHAARWLRLAADAYRLADREADWLSYRGALVLKHRFKKKFIAALAGVP